MAESAAPAATPAPQLDEVMLAMDVVDTLRHQDKLVERELGQGQRDSALRERLRQIYESQGLEVSERILEQGIRALKESRFVYTPPKPSFGRFMARLWVNRRPVGLTLGVLLVILALFVGWQVSRSNQAAQEADQQRIELTETLPAALATAGAAALTAAEDPDAVARAEALIDDGRVAVTAQDGPAMREAIAALDALRDDLVSTYTLTIVSREGEDTGAFRIPDVNEDARNFYIIVEAIDDSGAALSLPIVNEETGQTETVSMWGVRVPEDTFETVRADKQDDGIVQDNVLGVKARGTLAVDYQMDVADGAITSW